MKLTAQANPVFTLPNGDPIRHTRHIEVIAQIFVYHEPDQQWYVLLEHDTHTGQMNFPHGDLCWDEPCTKPCTAYYGSQAVFTRPRSAWRRAALTITTLVVISTAVPTSGTSVVRPASPIK